MPARPSPACSAAIVHSSVPWLAWSVSYPTRARSPHRHMAGANAWISTNIPLRRLVSPWALDRPSGQENVVRFELPCPCTLCLIRIGTFVSRPAAERASFGRATDLASSLDAPPHHPCEDGFHMKHGRRPLARIFFGLTPANPALPGAWRTREPCLCLGYQKKARGPRIIRVATCLELRSAPL